MGGQYYKMSQYFVFYIRVVGTDKKYLQCQIIKKNNSTISLICIVKLIIAYITDLSPKAV